MRAPSGCSRLAILVLGLYPLAFRRRYEEEMRAMIEESPGRLRAVIDLLRGAFIAHVRPPAAVAGGVATAERVRASASGVLACWVAFAAAGFGFYKTTEDVSFIEAGSAHPVLGDARAVIVVAGLLASGAVILGALPLILAALAQAWRQPRLRLVVSLPVLAVLAFIALTGALVLVAHSVNSHRPGTASGVVFIAWGVAGLACGAVCVVAARRALFAVPVSRLRLLVAYASGTLVTMAMAAITVAAGLYAIALPADASHLSGATNGPVGAVTVSASLIAVVVVMVLATAAAATTSRRGWRAARELRAGAGSTGL